jgi:guanylate kinase
MGSHVSKERLGILYILVGPGGVGKNALLNAVMDQLTDLRQLATATTRPPRENEQDGVHHLFVDLATFQQMIEDDALLEYQEVHPGKYYGVPRAIVEQAIVTRQDLIADIEYKGAAIIQKTYPQNTVAVFIAPPTYGDLVEQIGRASCRERV